MKVAVVHSFYSAAQPSGENEVVLRQIDALRMAGIQVQLFARYTDIEARRRLYRLQAIRNVVFLDGDSPTKELCSFRPDVVHVHNLFPNWAATWIPEVRVPVVATIHNYRHVCSSGLLWRSGQDCRECLDRGSWSAARHGCYRNSRLATLPLAFATRRRGAASPLLRHASALVALNSSAQSLFLEIASCPVHHIPNFADDPGVESGERSGWLYVGRLSAEKGVLELIRSFPPEESLVIVGDGPQALLVAQECQAAGNNRAYRGRRSHEDVIAEMRKARGLIIPSLWSEGIPTVALEGLAVGTPLVVSDHIGAACDLTSGGAGHRYRPAAPGSLAECLRNIRRSQSASCRQARVLFENRFSREVWLREILALYEAVISSPLRDDG